MDNVSQTIYHLVPLSYYITQPQSQPYHPQSFDQEGFIHCTAGEALLIEIANLYFSELQESLLVLEIDSQRLDAPLKYEAPITPRDQLDRQAALAGDAVVFFPHIYGSLNRDAIVNVFQLSRNKNDQWQLPD